MPVSTTSVSVLRRRLARRARAAFELLLHLRQAVAAEHLRVEVELEVEAAELGREVRRRPRSSSISSASARGPPARVDQEHLLLGADAAHAGLEAPLLEHPLEGAHVGEQLAGELTQPFGVELVGDVVAAHCGRQSTAGGG